MKKFLSTTRASSRHTSQSRRLWQLFALFVFLLLLWWVIPRTLYLAGAIIMAPINGVQNWVAESSASLPQYLRNRSELIDEIGTLRQQLADRGGDRYTVDMLAKENAELRSLLGDEGDERVLAGVIGRPNRLPYDMLMLDRGSRDGIVVGSPVYIGDRTVIGFVHSVSDRTSLVTLITTPDFQSTVYVFGPDIFATAVGMGGGLLRVGVPQGITVKEGDLVILPAITSGVYGAVSHIETIPTQPEQHAFVSPKTTLGSLRLVAVGKTPMVGATFEEALANVSIVRNELFLVDVPQEEFATSTQVGTTTSATSSISD